MPDGKGTYGSKKGRPPKRMSAGQKKIAGMAGNKSKIDAADLKKLRSKKSYG